MAGLSWTAVYQRLYQSTPFPFINWSLYQKLERMILSVVESLKIEGLKKHRKQAHTIPFLVLIGDAAWAQRGNFSNGICIMLSLTLWREKNKKKEEGRRRTKAKRKTRRQTTPTKTTRNTPTTRSTQTTPIPITTTTTTTTTTTKD